MKPVILERSEGSQPIHMLRTVDSEQRLYGEILRPQTTRAQDDRSSLRSYLVRNTD